MSRLPLKIRKKNAGPDGGHEPFDPALLVFSPEFVLGSIDIAEKEILRYIRGKSHQLGDDYYYSYIYTDGRLSFVATKSNRHVCGRHLPVLAVAFLNEGEFYYQQENKKLVYLVSNRGGVIRTDVGHDIPDGHTSLAEAPLPPAVMIPKTMFLKWSLARQTLYRDAILCSVLALSAAVYLFFSSQYAEVVKSVRQVKPEPPKVEMKRVKLAKTVNSLAKGVENKGAIRKLTISGGKAEIRLRFPSETRAQEYIAINGGRYDKNGEVVLTPPMPDWSQPVSDHQGDRNKEGRGRNPGKDSR